MHGTRILAKNWFFDLKWPILAFFENPICGFFPEISARLEISTAKIFRKKLGNVFYLPYKYLSIWTITFWDIAIRDRCFFFLDLTVLCVLFTLFRGILISRSGNRYLCFLNGCLMDPILLFMFNFTVLTTKITFMLVPY